MDEITETIIELLTHKGRRGIDERQTLNTLSLLENKLASSPSFHMVGVSWSLADIYSFIFVSEFPDSDLSAYPRLENFIKSFQHTRKKLQSILCYEHCKNVIIINMAINVLCKLTSNLL